MFMNNEIQRLHFEIKRINQRQDNYQTRLQALEQLKALVEAKFKHLEDAAAGAEKPSIEPEKK